MKNALKKKMQAMGSHVFPPPLKERPQENAESTWLEMIVSVGFSGLFYFPYWYWFSFSHTRDVPG